MGVARKFEELEVWQDASELAVNVYRDFELVSDFSFKDQIKRAVVSISNNVAEGAERNTPVDFARFLDIARGSCGEVRSMYRIAAKLGYVEEPNAKNRCHECESISRQLSGFAKYLRQR